jgi:hypothetical protein
MGQTKRLYEQMTLDELITEFFNQVSGDEDYQYQLYRERQLEEDRPEVYGDLFNER